MINKIIFSNKKYNVIILLIFLILFMIVFGLNFINSSYDSKLQSLYNLEENRILLVTYNDEFNIDKYKNYIDEVEILYSKDNLPHEIKIIIKQDTDVMKVSNLINNDGFDAILQYSETENDITQLKKAKDSFLFYYYLISFIVIIIFVLIVISCLKNDTDINRLLYAIGFSKFKIYFIIFWKYFIFISIPFIIVSILSLLMDISFIKLFLIYLLKLMVLNIVLIKNIILS